MPQGSILGPLLFLVYINHLGSIFQNFHPVLFANDSNLIVKGPSITDLEEQIKQDIPALVSWLQVNRLSLNLSKTHYMIFGSNKNKLPRNITIEIEGTTIEEVNEIQEG